MKVEYLNTKLFNKKILPFLLFGTVLFISGCTEFTGNAISDFVDFNTCESIKNLDSNVSFLSRDEALGLCYSAADEKYENIPINRDVFTKNCYNLWYLGVSKERLIEKAKEICMDKPKFNQTVQEASDPSVDSQTTINNNQNLSENISKMDNEEINQNNLALNKKVIGDIPALLNYPYHTHCGKNLDFDYSVFVDGNKEPLNWDSCDPIPYAEPSEKGVHWLMVDLGKIQDVDKLVVVHYHGYTYDNNIIEVSSDNINWEIIYDSKINGSYIEPDYGKEFVFPVKKIRYIRDWLKDGHWVELEAYNTKNDINKQTCPNSCSDSNSCTSDYCSEETNYTCEHKNISPCCGNDLCESGETYDSCNKDCEKVIYSVYDTFDLFGNLRWSEIQSIALDYTYNNYLLNSGCSPIPCNKQFWTSSVGEQPTYNILENTWNVTIRADFKNGNNFWYEYYEFIVDQSSGNVLSAKQIFR